MNAKRQGILVSENLALYKRIRELEAELAERREEYFVVVRERQDAGARVAELLEAIRNHDEYCPDECEYIEGGRWLKEQPEAREREAD
ncbi:MAG: hypothetical protein DMF49_09810 [Acidobacteria bacterium]|nr:MAG: hypothetical protein DMF49_09810 [Acidobacteriota bacterium]